ncbi:putative Rad26-like helical repeats domain-containing protein [Seiridium unicorne]|uniref:Rad26-like helical repeats domain-containing protein n=1 Tax=Seiridium unicorne TaxID=138068 RepID=A0ABR2USJ3_9PEZI
MDDFSDDGFDDLNVNVLEQLESNAIQFTQALTQAQKQPEPTQQDLNLDEFGDDDLDDAVITDDLRGKPALLSKKGTTAAVSPSRKVQQQPPPQQNRWGPVPIPASHFRPQPPSSMARPPAQIHMGARQPQYGTRQSQVAPYSQMRPPTLARPTPNDSRYQASQVPQQAGPTNAEQDALQARIQELELKLQYKDGEIDIVRRNLERHKQDHEREVQSLKKQTAEQISRSERAVEAAKTAQQTATTELEFTRRDLEEELGRAKRREKDGGTPKKTAAAKAWGVSDGFEDVEIAVSPSKGNRGRNPGAVASVMPEPPARLLRTPTKSKRKRPNIESPIMALETDEDVIMLDNGDAAVTTQAASVPHSEQMSAPRNPLGVDFLRVILNHSSAHGRPMTFDYLAGFALPSKPTESLAAILFQKLAVLGDPEDPMRLPIGFCATVIELWLQCHKEGCLAPIGELVSLITFTLQLNTIAIAPFIAEALVSTALDSWYEIGIPRLRNQSSTGDPSDATFVNLKENIPTSAILSVLYLTALGCATSSPVGGSLSDPIVDFWNCVHADFILMMIKSHKQPVDDFITTLRLLCTSAFDESIGPISTTPNRTVELVAPLMIERLSFHLLETHQWNVGQEKRWLICFTILRTLAAFARSTFGMKQLASNDHAIPRLVIFLSWTIDDMYDGDCASRTYVFPALEPSSPPKGDVEVGGPPRPSQHEPDEVQTLIAHAMLLLHTMITNKDNKNSINVSAKLSKFTGAHQKYLLSLGRLNFAEEGVSEETAELAHELLELAVTEDEGAELGEFFGG